MTEAKLEITEEAIAALRDPRELVSGQVKFVNPAEEQKRCLDSFQAFIARGEDVFILRGPAGSGKSTLIPIFAALAREAGFGVEICAPTGQAAKRLRAKGNPARTIHSAIYGHPYLSGQPTEERAPVATFRRLAPGSQTLWIVDEASMIGNSPYSDEQRAEEEVLFQDGNLFSDLLKELQHSDLGNRMLFIGDPHQLPPVRGNKSPCLEAGTFIELGLKGREFSLTELHRTQVMSPLRKVATFCADGGKIGHIPETWLGGSEITKDSAFEEPLARHGKDFATGRAIAVVSTNAQADAFNLMVRSHVHRAKATEAEVLNGVVPGDRLILSRTNLRIPSSAGDEFMVESLEPSKDRLIRGVRNHAGLDLTLQFVNLSFEETGEKFLISTFLVAQSLDSKTTSAEITAVLWVDLQRRIRKRGTANALSVAMDEAQMDPLFNSFRVKFAYARTCHKAQGGEWPIVVVIATDGISAHPRWGYTAATRAAETLSIISSTRAPVITDAAADSPQESMTLDYRNQLENLGYEVLDVRKIEHGLQLSLNWPGLDAGPVSINLFFKKGQVSSVVPTGVWSEEHHNVFEPALSYLRGPSPAGAVDIDIPESVKNTLDRMRATAEQSHNAILSYEVLEPWTIHLVAIRGETRGSTHFHFGAKRKGITSEMIDGKHRPHGDANLIALIRELKETRGI